MSGALETPRRTRPGGPYGEWGDFVLAKQIELQQPGADAWCQRWNHRLPTWRRTRDGGFDPEAHRVVRIPEAPAKRFTVAHHYSASWPVVRLAYGLQRVDQPPRPGEPEGGRLVGVLALGVPMNTAVLNVFPDLVPLKESLEFSRMCLLDSVASNGESWACARAFQDAAAKGIRGIVAHADPVPRVRITADGPSYVMPGHIGHVYGHGQGFAYLGRTRARRLVVLPDATVLNDRAAAKVRRDETGHAAVERRLIALGATARRAEEDGARWLARALEDVGATALYHGGCHKYARTIGPQRRRLLLAGPALPAPRHGPRSPSPSTPEIRGSHQMSHGLSPTGAKILDANDDGLVAGHPAALAKLMSDGLVVPHTADRGTHRITEGGWTALDAWRKANPGRTALADAPRVLPKLPGRQHEAVLAAARRPDQNVPGQDDPAYSAGESWFRSSTLRKIAASGYAAIRPGRYDKSQATWEETGRPLYLTEAGRLYARQRGNIHVRRRRVVVIACGEKKLPAPGVNEYGNPLPGYPAGDLYIGDYHRSLRSTADALTDPTLIFIASALHGLVPLNRPLYPYDVTLKHERAVMPETIRWHAAGLGLDDADVIFLGGQDYAALLLPSVPHLHTPLVGGMGDQRGQCARARDEAGIREDWWKKAATLHDEHAVR
ncbi:Mom family adenine methylcarbamoylation protein [Streptomyces sp. NPDC055036]